MLDVERMEDRWIAYVRDRPGCFASAGSLADCLARVPRAVADYDAWLRAHGLDAPEPPATMDTDEIHLGWNATEDNEVNAFFAADRPPLEPHEIERALLLLEWTRADLLASVAGLSPEALARPVDGGWSILHTLIHIGRADWWYLHTLGLAFPREKVPDDAFARLARVREHLRATLPTLTGDDRVVEQRLEIWSPRKSLRRALWHERDHTAQIIAMREAMEDNQLE